LVLYSTQATHRVSIEAHSRFLQPSPAGISGFLSGGGAAVLPSYGWAASRLLSAKVLLATGAIIDVSPTEHKDLFWAIRGGGGGNFGIITELKLQLATLPEKASFVVMTLPLTLLHSKLLSKVYFHHNAHGDAKLALSVAWGAIAPATTPGISLFGFYEGGKAGAFTALHPFLALTDAKLVTLQEGSYFDMAKLAADSGHRTFTLSHSYFIDSLPDDAQPTLVDQGKSLTDVLPKHGGAPGDYMYGFMCQASPKYDAKLSIAWHNTSLCVVAAQPTGHNNDVHAALGWFQDACDAMDGALMKDTVVGAYINYADPSFPDSPSNRDTPQLLRRYFGSSLDKLLTIKRNYDPHARFSQAQGLSEALP